MEQDFQSLSKGVFVVPFTPSEAGPSRPKRPLKKVYDESYARYVAAHEAYEKDQREEQLDHVAEWLEAQSLRGRGLLKRTSRVSRIPIAIIQGLSETVPSLLPSLLPRTYTLQARDATDLSAAVNGIAIGYVGASALTAKKSGKTGMDEVEAWYAQQKDRSPLLLHIQNAHLVPTHVLSELLYVLAIHPNLCFRVLLSVASTGTFLASWTHVEPSLIDLTIIQAGRKRKRGSAVHAILKAGADAQGAPISISKELADELQRAEDMTGGGAAAALKALKWSLLHHSFNSPLATLEEDQLPQIQAVVDAVRDGMNVPGRDLLQLSALPDLISTHDPAPRVSILHALAKPEAFFPRDLAKDKTPEGENEPRETASTPLRKNKRRAISPSPEEAVRTNDSAAERGDLKELEILFGLWRSAGRNVNLWDWLEGFQAAMGDKGKENDGGKANGAAEGEEARPTKRARQGARGADDSGDSDEDDGGNKEAELGNEGEEAQDRVHAAFIRFCEEARMLGLVRARGGRAGKRADEVVKGIGLV